MNLSDKYKVLITLKIRRYLLLILSLSFGLTGCINNPEFLALGEDTSTDGTSNTIFNKKSALKANDFGIQIKGFC